MYAIIETGGKQYQVEEGDEVDIELLKGIEPGGKATFSNVLLLSDGKGTEVGNPYVNGAIVEGELVQAIRGEKIKSIRRYVRRQNGKASRFGHRQNLHKIKITKVGKTKSE